MSKRSERGVASVTVIACGALASELRSVLAGIDGVDIRFLPANLHNRPDGIVPAVDAIVSGLSPDRVPPDGKVFLAYADCGTGGALDAYLAEHPGIGRLPGAHCYEFFAGSVRFAGLHDAEPGTFYLTDFLAKHFEALVWEGLGLDRHPELLPVYFGNYRRLVLLSQSDDTRVAEAARAAATKLGLSFDHVPTGLGPFAAAVSSGVA
jgi:hypothetical protein